MKKSLTMKIDLTGRNTPIDTAREVKVMRRYQKTEGFETDSAFAEALGLTRFVLSNYFNAVNSPTNDWLQSLALAGVGTWRGDLAVELLELRKVSVPCVCLEQVGDNGKCPKHGTLEVEAV